MLQVITRTIVGGAQKNTRNVCAAIRDDFDLRIVCGPDEGSEGSMRQELEEIAPVIVLPDLRRDIHPRQDLGVLRSLGRLYAELDPHIVHTHSSKAGIVGRLAPRPPSCRTVHTVHGWGHTPTDPAWRRRLFIQLERFAAKRTDALIAQSRDVREEGISLGIGRPGLYTIIPTGVDFRPADSDFARARRDARSLLGLASDATVIGWVGRFAPQKDPMTLAKTLSLLLSKRPTLQAVLVGDGPLRNSVERPWPPFAEQCISLDFVLMLVACTRPSTC